MKKSLSLLVAIAMVFSMFASVAFAADELTAEQKYEALVEAGIFEGFPDGEAHLDDAMTRAQAAKIIALLTGYTEETEVEDAGFTDLAGAGWAADYINYVAGLGIVNGMGDNKFAPSEEVTIEQLAKMVVETLEIEVDEEATVDGEVSDWAVAFVAAAVEAGLLEAQEDYTVSAVRELLVVASYSAYEIIGEPEVGAVVATAAGAKKIEVKFNKAVDDTKVTFSVKKGTINLNVASKSFSEDKKTATLELSSKLSEGEYTVSVGGVEEEALTSTFTAENEKVTKIEFLTTNAPLAELDTDGVDDLSIPYKVTNQYGENVTKTTTLSQNIGVVNSANGTIDITGNYQINQVVAVTLVHAETATSVVGTFTVAAQARVAEVAITGLYNKDNKTIDEATNLSTTAFYLLVDLKDQYGNAVKSEAKAKADLIINETNTTVVDVDTDFTTVEVDGDSKLALRINNPTGATAAAVGQSTVTLISNTTGKNASSTVVVAETTRADVINLINPGSIYVGEDAYVAVEVFDKAGNAITSLSALNNATKGVKITVNGNTVSNAFVLKDEIIQIKIPASEITTKGLKPVIAMTATNKVTTLNLNALDQAAPTVIRGLDADFAKAYLVGTSAKTISYTNLVIEDQYGRVMSDANVLTWLNAVAGRKIVVADTTSTVLALNVADITGAANANFDADVKGTEKLSFTLYKDGALVTSSVGETTITVTDGSEYTSYSADAIGTVYDETGAGTVGIIDADKYDKAVKVYGVLANGAKVLLTQGDDYVVNALSNAAVNGDLQDGTLDVTTSPVSYGDKTEVVVPVTVTINKTGAKLEQDVTFSKVAPKVASVKFVNAGAGVDASAQTSLTVTTATYSISDLVDGTKYDVVVTDQYGVKVEANANGTVEFADNTTVSLVTFTVTVVSGNLTIAGNGTLGATVSDIGEYEEFDVTITYTGGASATVRVKGL